MGANGPAGNARSADPKLDCYAILGVGSNADDPTILDAYKALTQKYQPERFAGSKEEAQRKLTELNAAYEILADPARRRRYDFRQRIDAKTAPFYNSQDGSRNVRQPLAVVSRIPVTAKPRRPRILLVALIGAVVVLGAFNLYQYVGRSNDAKTSIATTPSATVDTKPAIVVAPPPVASKAPAQGSDARSLAAFPSNTPAAPAATEAKAAGTGDAKATSATEAKPTDNPPVSTAAKGSTPAAISATGTITTTGAAPASTVQTRSARSSSSTGETRNPSSSAGAADTTASSPKESSSMAGTISQESKAAAIRASAARSTSLNRSGTASAAVAPERCTDAIAALGLCKPNSTNKDK